MSDDSRLDSLAAAALSGTPIDWDAAEADVAEADRAAVRELRVLALVAGLSADAGSDSPRPPGPAPTSAGLEAWAHLRILERVGQGAFGDVFRAWDTRLEREVALKLFTTVAPRDSGTAMLQEARLLARVRHPNVVAVYGADESDGRLGLWTEFVPGRTLEEIVRRDGPFSAEQAIRVGIAVCGGLSAVHRAGLVHRDVKAQNVMREEAGRVVLMDFGMVRRESDACEGVAQAGGTPLYMAPELFEGQQATVSSDLYALGVLLYHLVTGMYPVQGRTIAELREAHTAVRRPSLRELRPDLPAALSAAVGRALNANPDARGSVSDMEEALTVAWQAAAPAGRSRLKRLTHWAVGATAVAAGMTAISLLTRDGGIPMVREAFGDARTAVPAPVVTPSPAVNASAASAGTAPPAAASSTTLGARSWILIGAFENRTGQSTLDGIIEVELERELSQSQWVRVVPATRVQDALRLMKRPPGETLTVETALEVCRRDSEIAAVVTGHLARLGRGYRLDAQVSESRGGTTVAAVSAQAASNADLPAAARDVSAAVRRQLGESRDRIRASDEALERVTTPSMQALRLYSQSIAAAANNRQEAALLLAKDAVADDAVFASGHAWVAYLLLKEGKRDEAVAAIDKAVSFAQTANGPERLFITALAKDIQDGEKAAMSAWEAYLRLRPDDIRALERIVVAYAMAGREEDLARAYAKAARLRPNDYQANYSAAWYGMAYAGWVEEVRPFVARARALLSPEIDPELAAWVQFEPVFEHWMRGDARAAVRRLEAAAQSEDRSEVFLYALANMNMAFGRLKMAEAALARFPDKPFRPLWLPLAEIAAMRRDIRGGQAAIRAASPLSLPPSTAVNRVSAVLARLGLADEAEAFLAGQPEKFRKENFAFPPAEGEVALARGDLQRAVEKLSGWNVLAHGIPAHFIAGTSYGAVLERRGDFAAAAKVLETLGAHRNFLYLRPSSPIPFWLRSRAVLVRVYRALGRNAEAAAVDAELRRLLAFADPDYVLQD